MTVVRVLASIVLVLVIVGVGGTIVFIPHFDPAFDRQLMIAAGVCLAALVGIWGWALLAGRTSA